MAAYHQEGNAAERAEEEKTLVSVGHVEVAKEGSRETWGRIRRQWRYRWCLCESQEKEGEQKYDDLLCEQSRCRWVPYEWWC